MRNRQNIFTPIGGRRFVLTLGCGVVNTALVCLGIISGDVFATITLGTVGVFIGGNTAQKIWAPSTEYYAQGQNNGRQY